MQSANITAAALSNYTLTAGNGCSAVITPATATATYEWIMVNATTGAESVFATGSYITVPETAIGHRIKVRVRGAGIYGVSTFNAESGVDYIDSPLSNPIVSNKIVTAVALNNTSPVVGGNHHRRSHPRRAGPPARQRPDLLYLDGRHLRAHRHHRHLYRPWHRCGQDHQRQGHHRLSQRG